MLRGLPLPRLRLRRVSPTAPNCRTEGLALSSPINLEANKAFLPLAAWQCENKLIGGSKGGRNAKCKINHEYAPLLPRGASLARRKKPIHNGPGLYEEQERQLTHRIRRQRALFIPRFLTEAGNNLQLAGAEQDKAHQEICYSIGPILSPMDTCPCTKKRPLIRNSSISCSAKVSDIM